MYLFKLMCLWFLVKLSTSIFSESNFNYSLQMDNNGNYWVYWNILNDTYIEFGLKVKTLGWIGLGISPNGEMPDSDIVLTWIDDNTNKIYLEDRYAKEHSTPEYDLIQSLILIDGSQNDNYTYIRFIRPIYSCNDEDNDNTIEQGTNYLIYSWNDNDPISSAENISITWHGNNRGSKKINLLTYDIYNYDELPDDAIYFDAIMDNLSVPSNETTYWVKLIQLPLLNETNHIIKIEPIITEGNIDLVHHILLYECSAAFVNTSNIGLSMNNDEFVELPIAETYCKAFPAFAWAVGGDSFTFPSNIGVELSGLPITDNTFQYIILEIHYSNNNKRSDYYDSSGLRLWYTPTLREYSAGLMGIGISVNADHFIPQGIDEVINYGYCTSDCTSATLDETVHIFASLLHSHTAGIALRARHINKNGTELKTIDVNWNYDFSYQQMVLLSNEIDFNPGDSIMLECYYQTLDRTNMTYGGESTKQEMCLVFFYAYPKPKLRVCTTSFLTDDITTWNEIAIQKGYLTESPYYYNTNLQGAVEYYESLWSNYSNRLQICVDSDEGYFISTVPVITEEYINPYECNFSNSDDASPETTMYFTTTTTTSSTTEIETTTTTTTTTKPNPTETSNALHWSIFNINLIIILFNLFL